ncbi:hypothetical protein GC170_04955 [bacterium]|nr:hypothetical protein [bacterium]
MNDENSPDHPIIEKPWEFEIRYFAYYSEPDRWLESYIDLTLVRGDTIRRLRFSAPQELEIAKGFPVDTKSLQIQDVSRRRMENISVRVDCFEMDGVISFWAKDVMDLDFDGEDC